MSYPLDSKTLALYDLSSSGTNLQGNAAWNLTANGDGTYRLAPTLARMFDFGGDWTIEREVTITSAPGTILELGAWGETEAVNIQLVIGWTASRQLFVGWEYGEGMDLQVLAAPQLPMATELRVAVTRRIRTISIVVNGREILRREVPPEMMPTGGMVGSAPTPGMTLAIGYRVSTSDPQTYAGGGWLRISDPRTLEELQADWERTHPAPVPAGLTWEELARREQRATYYVFRGRYRANASSPGAVVAWATSYVHTDDGLLEGRLLAAPGAIAMGIPEKPEAPPERTTASLVLDNTDGALTEMLGGVADDPLAAYTGDSLLSLSGKIYLGYVAPDGSTVERAISPTLVTVGSPVSAGGRITIQLATDDAGILGPTKKLVTVRAVKEAEFVQAGERWTSEARGDVPVVPVLFDDSEFDFLKGQLTNSLDATVPFAWGRYPIPLTRVSEESAGRYLAYVTFHKPDLSWSSEWQLVADELRSFNWDLRSGTNWLIWSVKIQVQREDGELQQVWLVGIDIVGDLRSRFAEQQLWLLPAQRAHVGMPPGIRATPMRIVRQIITDLSERGGSAIDSGSFDRVDRTLRGAGTCGGIIDSGAPLSEILVHITGPWGIALWIDTDDQVHAARPTGWDAIDVVEVEAGMLPRVGLPEILEGSFVERLPSPAEWGGASARVSIDWEGRQQEFWPASQLPVTAPGTARLALAGEPEARISGAWIFPPEADVALRGVASRRSFVHRRISVALPVWVLAYPLVSHFRLSHPWGAEPGGYHDRLVRLVRREHLPGEDVVRCEFIDVGAYEHLRPGKLDSAANWVQYDPGASGVAIIFEAGSDKVQLTEPVVDGDWKGCSLWTFGATEPALRRSWRIVEVLSDSELRLRETPEEFGVVVADGQPPHRAGWVVMLNRTRAGPDYRPEYITVADAQTAQHTDGEPAFRFTA